MAVARSTGSARSKGPDSGATLSSVYEEAETEEPEAEKLVRKRSRAEIAATTPPAKKAATGQPIGKKGSLRSLYQFSSEAVAKKPEVEVKKAPSRPKFNIIPLRTATVEGEASGAEKHAEKPVDKVIEKVVEEPVIIPEVVKITGLDHPVVQCKDTEVQTEIPTAQQTVPLQIEIVQTTAGGVHAEGVSRDAAAGGGDAGGSGRMPEKMLQGRSRGNILRSVRRIHWATSTLRPMMRVAPMNLTPLSGT
ncbi:hypothetical protein HanRHA438_Chr11g0498521 [Helianthus annuus]|nr:hypothetical protein HanRHA438_Chr11g0498521 [Helianthus annuus]